MVVVAVVVKVVIVVLLHPHSFWVASAPFFGVVLFLPNEGVSSLFQ